MCAFKRWPAGGAWSALRCEVASEVHIFTGSAHTYATCANSPFRGPGGGGSGGGVATGVAQGVLERLVHWPGARSTSQNSGGAKPLSTAAMRAMRAAAPARSAPVDSAGICTIADCAVRCVGIAWRNGLVMCALTGNSNYRGRSPACRARAHMRIRVQVCDARSEHARGLFHLRPPLYREATCSRPPPARQPGTLQPPFFTCCCCARARRPARADHAAPRAGRRAVRLAV